MKMKQNVRIDCCDPRFSEPVDERLLTVDDLANMFNVSTKTVTRWRNDGLASGHFEVNGRQRIGFLKSSVDRFVAQHPDRIRRGASFSQLTEVDRENIIKHARLLADSGQSRQSAIKQIARDMNRSVETVRMAIKRYDAEHPESAVFETASAVPSQGLKESVYRQYCRGASLATLAKTFRRTTTQIRKIVNAKRVKRIQELPLTFVPSDEFERLTSDTILGPAPQPGGPQRKSRAPSELSPYLASLYDFPLLSKEQEDHLFRKYNYAKYQASKLREELHETRPSTKSLCEIERLYQIAVDTKNEIMQANLRLVVALMKKHAGQANTFHDLISDGNISLIKAIEGFDYSRGFKFSTYATWAIKRNYAGNYWRQMKRADRFRTGYDELLDGVTAYRANHHTREAAQHRYEEAVNEMLDCLDARERFIIEGRYGLGTGKEPRTLKEIGDDLSVSKERIRQIETRALAKLRQATDAKEIAALIEP